MAIGSKEQLLQGRGEPGLGHTCLSASVDPASGGQPCSGLFSLTGQLVPVSALYGWPLPCRRLWLCPVTGGRARSVSLPVCLDNMCIYIYFVNVPW